MRRVTGAAATAVGVLAAATLVPSTARAELVPVVPDPQQYVYSIAPQNYVYNIELGDSTETLKSESHKGGKTDVTINSDVLFAFNKATLTASAKKTLDGLVGKLTDASGAIQVDGYTDSKGSNSYNLKLSKQRAQAVQSYLSGKVSGKKISATGHGEADPVAPNTKDGKDNPAGREKNRRVEITY